MIAVIGANSSRAALRRIALPKRTNVSDRWAGIQHGALADTVVRGVEEFGMKVTAEKWALSKNSMGLFGGVDVTIPQPVRAKYKVPELKLGTDATYALGLRHTNDGRYSLTFATGARVCICENGIMTGEFVVRRKHTTGVDLDRVVHVGIERFLQKLGELSVNEFAGNLKKRELDAVKADHILMEAGRDNLLPWSHIGKVAEEYGDPTFAEFKPRTAWSLYNAFTYVAQQSGADRQMRMLAGLIPLMEAA